MTRPTYKTRDNRSITFEVLEQDPTDTAGITKGYVVHRINAFVDGAVVGYIKIEYIPQARFDDLYPDLLTWVARSELHLDPWGERDADTLRNLMWLRLVKDHVLLTDVKPSGCWGQYEEQDTPSPEQRDKDFKRSMKRIKARYESKYQDFIAYQVDVPRPAYIKVEDNSGPAEDEDGVFRFLPGVKGPNWRGLGIGLALYRFASRWLAQRGLALYSSGLQSDEAKGAWAKMSRLKSYPTCKEVTAGQERVVLDYRRAS